MLSCLLRFRFCCVWGPLATGEQVKTHLQKLLALDDYIKETVASKITLEMMLWRMRDPMFDGCDTEMECNDQHAQAKD